MSGNQADLAICEEITKKLLQLPGAILFDEPLNQNEEQYPNYSKHIKNPQDLKTILTRLQKNEYQNVAQWEKDINLVWSNCETYNGRDSYVACIARHMQKHFEKLKRKCFIRKINGWIKNVYIWKEKIDKMLYSPPPGSKLSFLPEIPYTPIEYNKFTTKELDALIDASRTIFASRSDYDLKQVAKIIAPDIANESKVEDLVINVETLSPKTLHALREYFKKKIPDYPQ
ncbi:Bromodomain containing protein [Trichomonas vaginalis G3]|uniref:Bromodomain containing protein n=1 Tax=Trichomonas vaginalis (strain ATCC PRA-98 / G3) TaxID=412133 RepID=A2DZ03_TRIV3|nr:chromatin remodeling [Trichomonas vaginalis G3]EAY14414.1 Bromodomain containing protein [Trichomonas vaginalis G3]KAI5501227.1 chromatin remodeling [Trichomonas vaginalis G3]|eukprot:XP_001326637.1 Bromodomain containing protein [Trichomonas vaginalis G3]